VFVSIIQVIGCEELTSIVLGGMSLQATLVHLASAYCYLPSLGCPLMLRSVIYLYQYITQKITLLGCLATSDVTIIALTNTQLES